MGLGNYKDIFFVKTDFIEALKNTGIYTFYIVVILIFMSLIFALWMFDDRRINRIAQTAFFTPHLVASVSCAFIWSWLFSSDTYGLVNTILRVFGVPPVNWLGDVRTAMGCIIAMNVWKSIGYYALILLSALKAIPTEIYEAAKLDDASRLKIFWKITLPMLSPQLFFLLITITIGSFESLTRSALTGGVGTTTQVISLYIYNYAFQRNNTLAWLAAGVVLMLILIFVTLVDFKGLSGGFTISKGGAVSMVDLNKQELTARRFIKYLKLLPRDLFKIIVMLLFAFPFYWMLITAFKTYGEAILTPPTLWPRNFTVESFQTISELGVGLWRYALNSVIVTLSIIAIQMVIMSLAAYAFAKRSFPLQGILFGIVMVAFMIPEQITYISVFLMMSRAKLINTLWPQILPFGANAFGIFLSPGLQADPG